MAFVAGYLSKERQYTTEELVERLGSFSILPGEAAACEQRVVEIPHGHLLIKHRMTYPIPPRLVVDERGSTLATLGFLDADPKDVLTACVGSDARTLDDCEGEFIAAFADVASGALHVVNDRFAARPCYILRTAHAVYFSSNVAWLFVLARQPYRPDLVGWLEAFSYAHTNGARTTADGVQRLRPARHLTIKPEGVHERQYWRLEHEPDLGLDPATHSADVFQAFCVSAERRARLLGSGVLALSGGLDSRLVAAAIPKDTDFSAFTFVDVTGAEGTAQTRAAAQVCAALGLRHRIEALPSRFARPADVIALTGGMRPYHHMAIAMAYVNEIRRRGEQFLLGGGPGDSLAGAFIPSPAYLDPARTAECLTHARQRRLARSHQWSLVFRDDVIASGRPIVEDELTASFAAVGGPTAAHRITAWAMVYRQPAFTLTSVFHTHPEVTEAACHLGYRYSDLMLRLPAPWMYGRAFYAFMIHRELPQLRHIPYANTGALLTGKPPSLVRPRESIRSKALRLARLGPRGFKRLVRAVAPRRERARGWLVLGEAALLAEVQEILHATPSLGEVLDLRRCDDFIEKVRTGVYQGTAHEEVLGGLVAMCFCATTLPHSRGA
jgi:Asparagine synthase